jgi:alpha-tubulin suppressor-like RCC1 family protein
MPAGCSAVADVSCGNAHVIFRASDGKAFGYGANNWLQLGIGPRTLETTDLAGGRVLKARPETETDAQQIRLGAKGAARCVDVCAGGDSSLFLVEDPATGAQQLYSAGFGSYGTLGNGYRTHAQGVPVKIAKLSEKSVWDEQLGRASRGR